MKKLNFIKAITCSLLSYIPSLIFFGFYYFGYLGGDGLVGLVVLFCMFIAWLITSIIFLVIMLVMNSENTTEDKFWYSFVFLVFDIGIASILFIFFINS